MALNYLLRTCLSLKHPLSCRASKQLDCMAQECMVESVFWMDFECFSANQKPRRKSP